MDDFVISKLSWHTDRPGNEELVDDYRLYFFSLVKFFQDNGLTHRVIVDDLDTMSNDAELRSSDLTGLGQQLVKFGYVKYQRHFDSGGDPRDVSILEKELGKLKVS